ncbi:MAG: hypothetical protein WA635_07500 [Gallionella sp.]
MQFLPNPALPSVGNRIIDSEHNKLLGMISDIAQLIHIHHGVALSVAIRLLNEGLRDYFAAEEKVARAVNFDFADHRLAHQKLFNEIKLITGRIMSQNDRWSSLERKDCITSLNDCLIKHIKVDSKPFKTVLNTYSYDFKPGGSTTSK